MSVRVICDSMGSRHRLKFTYNSRLRVVEPHLCGQDRHGHDLLTGWQVGGASSSLATTGWRTFRVDLMNEMEVLDESFEAPRASFVGHDSRITLIHCSVALGT